MAGLGRSKRTAGGALIFNPTVRVTRHAGGGATASLNIPRRLTGRIGKTVAPQTNTAFYKKVIHPGLAERRMFPTEERLFPALAEAATAFVTNILARRA